MLTCYWCLDGRLCVLNINDFWSFVTCRVGVEQDWAPVIVLDHSNFCLLLFAATLHGHVISRESYLWIVLWTAKLARKSQSPFGWTLWQSRNTLLGLGSDWFSILRRCRDTFNNFCPLNWFENSSLRLKSTGLCLYSFYPCPFLESFSM